MIQTYEMILYKNNKMKLQALKVLKKIRTYIVQCNVLIRPKRDFFHNGIFEILEPVKLECFKGNNKRIRKKLNSL